VFAQLTKVDLRLPETERASKSLRQAEIKDFVLAKKHCGEDISHLL
jgi:hypothetical protein